MVKLRIINDANYACLKDVTFPVEVVAEEYKIGYTVSKSELVRVGANIDLALDESYFSASLKECEVINVTV